MLVVFNEFEINEQLTFAASIVLAHCFSTDTTVGWEDCVGRVIPDYGENAVHSHVVTAEKGCVAQSVKTVTLIGGYYRTTIYAHCFIYSVEVDNQGIGYE